MNSLPGGSEEDESYSSPRKAPGFSGYGSVCASAVVSCRVGGCWDGNVTMHV
jgi:hypothetical protein